LKFITLFGGPFPGVLPKFWGGPSLGAPRLKTPGPGDFIRGVFKPLAKRKTLKALWAPKFFWSQGVVVVGGAAKKECFSP